MAAHPLDAGTSQRPWLEQGGLVHNVRVGRQALYDAERRVVAYQLRFHGPAEASFEDQDLPSASVSDERATSLVIGATFGAFGVQSIAGDKPVFINFTRAFLTGMLPIPVEPGSVIIEVTDQVGADHELLLGLAQLKQRGFRIAVDNYRGDIGRSALIELADVVTLDVNALSTLVVPGLVQACRAAGASLLACGVADQETFERCQAWGFAMFGGEHLERPTVVDRRMLSPSQAICARLLNDLSDPEVPLSRIEEMVGSDPGLSMRLLRSAHSASGAGREVESLRQALVLIGPRRLRSWVVLTLLEGTTTPNPSDDLWNVLTRAFACRRLSPTRADLAYTVGLLAGAADLLGTDPTAVADAAGIGHEARAALLDGDGEAGRALAAVRAHEHNDEDGVQTTGLALYDVSRAYLDGLHEALQLVHGLLGR